MLRAGTGCAGILCPDQDLAQSRCQYQVVKELNDERGNAVGYAKYPTKYFSGPDLALAL